MLIDAKILVSVARREIKTVIINTIIVFDGTWPKSTFICSNIWLISSPLAPIVTRRNPKNSIKNINPANKAIIIIFKTLDGRTS